MHIFLLTVRGVFTKHLSARWAIVQLAGRRILVPLIVVQVHVAQPTRTQTSPSSSRPRTAAFHAVNSGSNPLGDANRKLKAHHSTSIFRGMWCVFFISIFALTFPLSALKPLLLSGTLSLSPLRRLSLVPFSYNSFPHDGATIVRPYTSLITRALCIRGCPTAVSALIRT